MLITTAILGRTQEHSPEHEQQYITKAVVLGRTQEHSPEHEQGYITTAVVLGRTQEHSPEQKQEYYLIMTSSFQKNAKKKEYSISKVVFVKEFVVQILHDILTVVEGAC